MSMGPLKERYVRYKRWQRHPIKYSMSNEKHRCKNCGHSFTGNYCPCCSQKADLGRVGWRSVHRGIMDIWGLGTRSLLYSLWQLIWRPGYLIKDYISGKRQVCFPPVKMLFIVAVIFSFIFYWFFPHVLHVELEPIDQESINAVPYLAWQRNYFSWSTLVFSMVYILPTWFLFRYAPRYPLHTLPEGFFIQILMNVLFIVIDMVTKLLLSQYQEIYLLVNLIALVAYYYIAYRQLFGYGVWGTIWRQVFMWVSFGFLLSGVLLVSGGLILSEDPSDGTYKVGYQLGFAVFFFALSFVVMVVGFLLNRLATRNRFRKKKEELIRK